MKFHELHINAADGTLLNVEYVVPDSFHSLAILVHGLAEHSARYRERALFLAERGFAVFIPNHRGHGKSGGRRAHVLSFQDYLSDLMVVSKNARDITQKGKFLLFGHSMGGLISANFAGIKPDLLSGLVLSSPFFGFAMKVPAFKAIGGKLISGLWPSLSMPTGIDPNHVSHDPVAVAEYANDPMVSKIVSARWFTETVKAQTLVADAMNTYTGPLLVMQAGDDLLASASESRKVFEGAASADKEFYNLEGFYHDIFHEAGKKAVYEIFDQWLKAHPAI